MIARPDDPTAIAARTALEIARDVAAGDLDPVSVVDAFHAVIEAGNPALNALVRYDPEPARVEARIVARRVRAGERMPLAGVPLIVKDNIFVSGRRITSTCSLRRISVISSNF